MVEITITAAKFGRNRFGECLESRKVYRETYHTPAMAGTMLSKVMDVHKYAGDDISRMAFTTQIRELV